MLAERMSTNEIAEALGIRWDVADGDVTAVRADPNNIDYISPKHALGRLLDNYDALEREAREQLAASVKDGKLEAANRWFESIRRIGDDRGRVLHQIGLLNRAADEVPKGELETRMEDLLSPRARALVARIALAEKMGHRWTGEIEIEDTTAIEPVPAPTAEPAGFAPDPGMGGAAPKGAGGGKRDGRSGSLS